MIVWGKMQDRDDFHKAGGGFWKEFNANGRNTCRLDEN
jgi:hypothetical protein